MRKKNETRGWGGCVHAVNKTCKNHFHLTFLYITYQLLIVTMRFLCSTQKHIHTHTLVNNIMKY